MKYLIIKLNPDKNRVKEVTDALKLNDGYCPCQIIRSKDTKCMCKDFRESEEEGYCHCKLYYKYTLEDLN